jgi:RNA polymerase sigma-70 factor (ECF subfamily)
MSAEDKPVPATHSLAAAMAPGPDWAGLIDRCAAGDESALGTLYDQTAALVNGLAFRILGDATSAEEVTGDVYLQVWRQAARYDRTRGAPLAWLLVLTRTRAIDRLRARRAPPALADTVEPPVAPSDPEDEAAVNERRRIVQGALGRLPPEQRQVIELAYFGGLSQSEIAATVGEPLGTVKTRIRLAMLRLRHALGAVREEST